MFRRQSLDSHKIRYRPFQLAPVIDLEPIMDKKTMPKYETASKLPNDLKHDPNELLGYNPDKRYTAALEDPRERYL